MNDDSRVWDKLHDNYSESDWINKPNIFAEQILELLPKTRGKLLDIGCGQGQDSRFFAANGFTVTGIDISDKALVEAKSEKEDITFIKVDISQSLPFEDASFDVVYAHLSLHYFDLETTNKIFAEIARVLKSEGILAFFTNSTSDPEYGQGDKIEEGLYFVEGKTKRYLSADTAKKFAAPFFDVVLADNKGETYKDSEKGIHNLIRYIGKKLSRE